jgi:hypothetical protein
MADSAFHLLHKVEAKLVGQMAEIRDQVCDSVGLIAAKTALEILYGFRRAGKVVLMLIHALSQEFPLFFCDQAAGFASGARTCDSAQDILAPSKNFRWIIGCEKRTLAASFLEAQTPATPRSPRKKRIQGA